MTTFNIRLHQIHRHFRGWLFRHLDDVLLSVASIGVLGFVYVAFIYAMDHVIR